jgi:tetratricopeptide (TPR) repeat protein/2-polyprenyl-3-methyl-5-hydroxy-6-metoxy-1,4-benzoquinol methylase
MIDLVGVGGRFPHVSGRDRSIVTGRTADKVIGERTGVDWCALMERNGPNMMDISQDEKTTCVPETLEAALGHHQAGELDQAEKLYQQVLRIDSGNADSLHLLGVVAHQRDQNDVAVGFINRAIEVDRSIPLYHSNLGASYRSLGQFDRAVDSFREAIQLAPEFGGAHYNLGMVLEIQSRHDDAIASYLEAIRIDGTFVDAHNNLGKVYAQMGRTTEAIERFQKVVELSSESAAAHYNLGNAYNTAGRLDESAASFRKALRCNPDLAEAHNNLGTVQKLQARFDEALESFQNSVRLNPGYADARRNLAAILQYRGKFDEAIEHLQQAVAANPQDPHVECSLATALRAEGRYEDAAIHYHNAIRIDPDHADAQFGLGYLLLSEGKHDAARRCYERLLEIDPHHTAALNNLGSILTNQNELTPAAECFKAALEEQPTSAAGHYNLGNAYKDQWQLEDAADSYRRALDLKPEFSAAHVNLGVVLKRQGKLDEAIASHKQAVEISPLDAEANFHLALALLLNGDFKQGWEKYEWRWQYEATPREFAEPVWDGSPLEGRSLLVYAEQGVGDEIMFASCLPEIISQTSHCVVECDPRLVRLLARSFPLAKVIPRPIDRQGEGNAVFPPVDIQIAMGSLPRYLRPNADCFPAQWRYLSAEKQLVEKWRTRYRELGEGLKVGISWRGGGTPAIQQRRSTSLADWNSLFSVAEVQFINLQYGDAADELAAVRAQSGVTIHDWEDADPLKDLDDFAAQIAALDMVISVDNSNVHLAGALGVPVWTLLPFAPNWRWRLDRVETSWYPTMTLYRPPCLDDWGAVFDQVAADVKSLTGSESFDRHIQSAMPGLEIAPAEVSSTGLVQTVAFDRPGAAKEKEKYEEIWKHDSYRVVSPGFDNMQKFPLGDMLRQFGVKTVLDAGCGSGKLMQQLITEHSEEFTVHGFDISSNCLDPFFDDIKQEILTVGCLWDAADFCEEYDAIICTDVLEHIPPEHVAAVLRNLRQCTRKICYLAIALFADSFGPMLLGEPLHLTVETPEWWLQQITSAGFAVHGKYVEKTADGRPIWLHTFATV